MEKVNTEHKRGNPWVMWGFVIFLVVVMGAMCVPVTMRCSKKAAMTTTTSNAKQIFYLMIEFDDDFGRFPTDTTAVDDLKGYRGEYSNDYLAQFIGGGYTKSEEIFYARGGSSPNKRPDNVITNREDQLREGECGFAYIKDLSTKSNSGTPLLLAPMYGDGYKFNSDIYQGKAVILRIDGAVKQLLLDKDDRQAKIGGGKTLFDGGPESVWGAKGFDQTKLCYANKPYAFTPRIGSDMKPKDWLVSGLVVLFIIVLLRVIYQARSKKSKPQHKIAS